jgi:hypothetical protein
LVRVDDLQGGICFAAFLKTVLKHFEFVHRLVSFEDYLHLDHNVLNGSTRISILASSVMVMKMKFNIFRTEPKK